MVENKAQQHILASSRELEKEEGTSANLLSTNCEVRTDFCCNYLSTKPELHKVDGFCR